MQAMPLSIKNRLEDLGFEVTVKADPKTHKMFTWVKHPVNPADPLSGLDVKYFNNLKDITHDLVDNGESVDINYYHWPVNDCPPFMHNPGSGYDAQVEFWEEAQYDAKGNLALWTWFLVCAAIAMTVTVIVSLVCWFIEKINAPCTYEENWINECWVSITNVD